MARVDMPDEICECCEEGDLSVETTAPRCRPWEGDGDGPCCDAWHAEDGDIVTCNNCGATGHVVVEEDGEGWVGQMEPVDA